MKRTLRKFLPIMAIFSTLLIVSCGEDNEEIQVNTGEVLEARFNNTDSTSAAVSTAEVTDMQINVRLELSDSDNDRIRRVYITKNEFGQGFEPVDAEEEFGVNAKVDGSIDIASSDNEGVVYFFNFNLEDLPDAEGTIVYRFWATKNKGDFRDEGKDRVQSVATLTINLGGINPAQELEEYTGVIRLEAPTADGTSETFISMLDGETYEINEGEELAAFWDFGFYYLNSTGVSLASTAEFPNLFKDPQDPASAGETSLPLVDVNTFLGVEVTEINNAYFQLAPTNTDFDSFSTASDLSFTITTNDEEDINNLQIGDVVYILDQYGNKGVIEITDLVGSFGSDGFVEFDMKVANPN